MSGYNARRAPNVSQYIANLNTIPSEHEMATAPDLGDLDSDLALFTNPEFFDFDLAADFNVPEPLQYDPAQEERARRHNAQAHFRHGKATNYLAEKSAEYVPNTDFNFPDYSGVSNALPDPSTANIQQPHQQQHAYPIQQFAQTPIHAAPPNGNKRKIDAIPTTQPITPQASPQIIEEASRVAAEEDKRRRNTAASARFRVKKKQREQALERTAKDMTEKVNVLEARVGQLEMENKWLKGLLVEKHDGKGDIAELKKQMSSQNEGKDARSTDEHTTGVGTGKDE